MEVNSFKEFDNKVAKNKLKPESIGKEMTRNWRAATRHPDKENNRKMGSRNLAFKLNILSDPRGSKGRYRAEFVVTRSKPKICARTWQPVVLHCHLTHRLFGWVPGCRWPMGHQGKLQSPYFSWDGVSWSVLTIPVNQCLLYILSVEASQNMFF